MLEDRATMQERLPRDEDLRAASSEVIQAAKARILQLFDLAAAEARLAAMSIVSMLTIVIAASAALIIAWALLVALAIYLLLDVGVPWPMSAIALALAHVGAAYLLWRTTVRLSRNLTLPKLRSVLSASGSRSIDEAAYVEIHRATGAR